MRGDVREPPETNLGIRPMSVYIAIAPGSAVSGMASADRRDTG